MAQETLFIRRVCQDTVNTKNNTIYWSFKQDSCKIIGTLTLWGRDGSTASPFQIIETRINPNDFETIHTLAGSSTWEYYLEATLNCGSINKSFLTKTIKVDNLNPSKIELDSVSVDVKNNLVILGWKRGPETDINRFEIYHTPLSGGGLLTGYTNQPFFVDEPIRNPKNGSLSYQVTAVDSCGNRPATGSPHSTIFLSGKTDTCKMEVNLQWQNYAGWPNAITNEIYEYRNDSFILIGSVPFATINFTTYCKTPGKPCAYFIRTIKSSSPMVSSSSNLFESLTFYRMPQAKPVINHVTTNPSTDQISISISTKNNQDSSTLFTFTQAANITTKQSVLGDVILNVGPSDNRYLYRVSSTGACKNDTVWSPYSTNISLKSRAMALNWNPYFTWNRGVEKYLIHSFSGNYTPSELDYVVTGESFDTTFNINEPSSGFTNCYFVEAIEKGGIETAKSNHVCIGSGAEGVYWPNAIVMGSSNNVFKVMGPGVLNTTPTKTLVYDRWGNEVFRGNLEAFDGHDMAGKELDQGVYLFKAIIIQFNETKEIKGTISILK